MALTKPAGCFLQFLSIPICILGLVVLLGGSTGWGWVWIALAAMALVAGGTAARTG